MQAINLRLGGYWVGGTRCKVYTYVKFDRRFRGDRRCQSFFVFGRHGGTAVASRIHQIPLFARFELERIARRRSFRRFRADSKNGTLSQFMENTMLKTFEQKVSYLSEEILA